LAEEEARLANQQAVQARIREVKYTIERMAAYLDHLTFAQKRNLLFALGVQVFVWRGRDPTNKTDPRRMGQRFVLRTDFTGLNLGARLASDWEEIELELTMPVADIGKPGKKPTVRVIKSTVVGSNNNASNYSIANAFDLQELMGLPVAGGAPIPETVAETMASRAAQENAPDGEGQDRP
ncbi:MAG TPA: hypothetical protein VF040_04675, partial [Ktedonobacterales bacterium]